MAGHDASYPAVFVVDSSAAYPPVTPRPSLAQRGGRGAQTLLFALVSLALCGVVIEACFIYHLYQRDTRDLGASSLSSKSIQGKPDPPAIRTNSVLPPLKPVVHLNAGGRGSGAEPLQWVTGPVHHQIQYRGGKLVIQKEGYYYVYSKLYFRESSAVFEHSVVKSTPRYLGSSITLQRAREGGSQSGKMAVSNSYLGGVWHLYANDSISVMVSNNSHVIQAKTFDNCFGAFMI